MAVTFTDHWPTLLKPFPIPVPWLAVLLLYITLPKCNLLKHALTQLLRVELKKIQRKRKKNMSDFTSLSLTYIQIARPVLCFKILTREMY